MAAEDVPPGLIATIGLHGSASTWVFNVIREMVAAAVGEAQVLALYADEVGQVPDEAARGGRHMVIKSHHGSQGLDAWLAGSRHAFSSACAIRAMRAYQWHNVSKPRWTAPFVGWPTTAIGRYASRRWATRCCAMKIGFRRSGGDRAARMRPRAAPCTGDDRGNFQPLSHRGGAWFRTAPGGAAAGPLDDGLDIQDGPRHPDP